MTSAREHDVTAGRDQEPDREGRSWLDIDVNSWSAEDAAHQPLVLDDSADDGVAVVAVDLHHTVDRQIIRLLRQHGEDSRLARELAGEFRDVGVGSILKLYKEKMLFRRLTVLRIYVPSPPANLHKEIASLAHLSAYGAVPVFIKEYVFGDKWDPRRGGSLKTCLVNACLCRFGQEYRRFCRQERHDRVQLTSNGLAEELEPEYGSPFARHPHGPEEQVLQQESIINLLATRMRPEDKIIVIRKTQGFTEKQIAEELGITVAAVNSSLRRSKKKIAESKREDG